MNIATCNLKRYTTASSDCCARDWIVVLSVNPIPGTTITAGSGVTLEIASGNVQVPSLVGLSEINAKTVLTQAGFLIREITASDPSKPIGEVLAQAPEGGATKTIGSVVTITVNRN